MKPSQGRCLELRKNITDGNLALTGFSDIFKSTAKSFAVADGESVVEIPLDELYPPEYHPFLVLDDDSMTRLSENIKRYGVREPGLARPRADGRLRTALRQPSQTSLRNNRQNHNARHNPRTRR